MQVLLDNTRCAWGVRRVIELSTVTRQYVPLMSMIVDTTHS